MYVCMYVRMYVCMYVCVYIYIHIHKYIHTYTYMYIPTEAQSDNIRSPEPQNARLVAMIPPSFGARHIRRVEIVMS